MAADMRTSETVAVAPDLASFERLIRVETKLDLMLHASNTDIADHETRIRAIEKIVWKAVAVSTVVSGVIATGANFALRYLGT